MEEANFTESDLRGAFLGVANLQGADLTRAELNGTVFTSCKLFGAKIVSNSLSHGRHPINLYASLFGANTFLKRGKIDECNIQVAAATYRALKAYFSQEGKYDDASWAAYSERLMQRKALFLERRLLEWLASLFFGLICGYGEKPFRVVTAVISTVFGYALVFESAQLLIVAGGNGSDFDDALYFSATTFCTMSVPGYQVVNMWFARALVASEAFWGLFFFGVFVFVLTRRFVAR